jgi:hypothetical protein
MNTGLTPSFLLGALLCLGYASIFHLWRGRGVRDLLLAVPVAALGFGVGHLLSATTTSFLDIGQLQVVEGTIGAWLALVGIGILLR